MLYYSIESSDNMVKTKISLYSVCIILSLVVGLIVIIKNLKRSKLKKEESLGLLVYIVLGTLYGAKLFTILTNLDKGIISFNKAGLSSYGAVIGIILMLVLFKVQFKKKLSDLLYIVMPAIPIMYAIGKIGCFLVGCCYGIEYNGPFNIMYKYSLEVPNNIHLFPIQIVETIIFTLIFFIIRKVEDKKISLTFILCAISKFILGFLRYSHNSQIISTNQIVSIIFLIIGIIWYNKEKNRGNKYE